MSEENMIITQARHKIGNYEKGLNIIKDLMENFFEQPSLQDRFNQAQNAIEDIKLSIESMANVRQEDAYMKDYFQNKFDHLKRQAFHLLSQISQDEFRIGSQKAQEYFEENTEWIKEKFSTNPFMSAAVAFAAGLVVSSVLRSGK